MACARAAQRSRCDAPPDLLPYPFYEYSLTEVSLLENNRSSNLPYGGPTATHALETQHKNSNLLENEVMVDPWSSMESSNSPLTESGPSASDESPASTRPDADPDPADNHKPDTTSSTRYLLLDEEYHPSPILELDACKIPKPHFLDHSPSPDDFDDKTDITNPNFLDEDDPPVFDRTNQCFNGSIPKQNDTIPAETQRVETTLCSPYRSHLHFGMQRSSHSSERDKRASQLYHGTWPGERDTWQGGQDTGSVKSFSSAGSANGQINPHPRLSTHELEPKVECVYSLLSMLSMAPESDADMSESLLEMSQSIDSCLAMRQSGCIPILVQLIHSKLSRSTRDRAAQALFNIVHAQPDDKAGRREARALRLLTQVREYCYTLEDFIEMRRTATNGANDDSSKHPGQSVAALMKLSFDEVHRHVVCQLGGLQTLASLVSLDQVAHGSHVEDSTCITMRKYAGMALTNLTFGDGNNKALLCSFKDFMLALVDQLQSPNDDMRQVTAAVLRNLSWRADSNSKAVLREVGAVVGLTSAAMSCHKEATLKSVLSALWNLTAHCSLNKVDLCSVDGALGFLVEMLSFNAPSKTLAIVENSGGILRNVSSHIAVREDYRLILRERNCLRVLLAHLKSPSLTVVSNSCGTLWNLSARCSMDQQYLWDHGAVAMLRSLIHSKHKMIAMGSSAALKNLLNSKPGKSHIISLDSTARNMNLPALPTLGARKQKALEQEIDQNLAETCDNIEPATSPTTNNRDEKNLLSATERHLAMNVERHRMSSSSPLVGHLQSHSSLTHSAYISGYLSAGNTILRNNHKVETAAVVKPQPINRSESKDSILSSHSDTGYDKSNRVKVPVPTPRNRDISRYEEGGAMSVTTSIRETSNITLDVDQAQHSVRPPIPPRRNMSDLTRSNYSESDFDGESDLPTDFTRTYCENKSEHISIDDKVPREALNDKVENVSGTQKLNDEIELDSIKNYAAEEDEQTTYGDYQETDLDQPTDFSLRYREHQSDNSSELSVAPHEPVHEDTIQHFCTEGTPYETPIIFSTATSMTDLRGAGLQRELTSQKSESQVKDPPNPNIKTHSPEKKSSEILIDALHNPLLTQSQDPLITASSPNANVPFDSKFSSGMISPEKPINYCDEGTPGCFSRVSSLSSLGESNEESTLAKRNAMATVNVLYEAPPCDDPRSSIKEREGMKAVTFAASPAPARSPPAPDTGGTPPPPARSAGASVQETPLMFSRCSSLGSLSGCSAADRPLDDQGSIVSEISRMTSGCISPSELPDSPGQSIPQSPRAHGRPASHHKVTSTPSQHELLQDLHENVATFQVENTPLEFSTATSLSSLTIDDDPPHKIHLNERCLYAIPGQTGEPCQLGHPGRSGQPLSQELAASAVREVSSRDLPLPLNTLINRAQRFGASASGIRNPVPVSRTSDLISVAQSNTEPPTGDSCFTYLTEDTPAVLSKAGSHGDLSLLSLDTGDQDTPERYARDTRDAHDTSTDSCDLSDQGEDLLANCIQMGIKAINQGKPQLSSVAQEPKQHQNPSADWHQGTHSGHTQTDIMLGEESPPPPLPPKPPRRAPPAPPRPAPQDMRREAQGTSEGRNMQSKTNLVRNDSLSSLSIESFGSTDRELFEQCVKSGMPKNKAKATGKLKDKRKSHSAEHLLDEKSRRPAIRSHKSLDRSDQADLELESLVARGAQAFLSKDGRSREHGGSRLKRSAFTYHGDGPSNSLCHEAHAGPLSLPASVSQSDSRMTRSGSHSSLSGDSMGSTDMELFEQCVKMGMTKSHLKGQNTDENRKKTLNKFFKMQSTEPQNSNTSVNTRKEHNCRSERHSRPPPSKHSDITERVKNKTVQRCASEDGVPEPAPDVLVQDNDKLQRQSDRVSESDLDLDRLVYVGAKSFTKPGSRYQTSLPHISHHSYDRPCASRAKPISYSEGPQSLPVWPPVHGDADKLTRSNSLSSLSGDSLGSTDLELFEQCVIAGMTKSKPKSKCTEDIHTRTLTKNFKAQACNPDISKRESAKPCQPRKATQDMDFDHLVSLGAKAFIKNDQQISRAFTNKSNLEPTIPYNKRSVDDRNLYLSSKNVPASSVVAEPRPSIDNSAPPATSDVKSPPSDRDARTSPDANTTLTRPAPRSGSEPTHEGLQLSADQHNTHRSDEVKNHSENSFDLQDSLFDKSNEYPAQDYSPLEHSATSVNRTDLDVSNESYANMLTQSANSFDVSYNILNDDTTITNEVLHSSTAPTAQTLTRSCSHMQNAQVTFVEESFSDKESNSSKIEKYSRKNSDTWEDNTCPNDISFPTISGSVPAIPTFKNDINNASTAQPPDLAEENLNMKKVDFQLNLGHNDIQSNSFSDITPTNEPISDRAKVIQIGGLTHLKKEKFLDLSFGPSSLQPEDESSTFTSLTTSTIIEKEAAQLAENLRIHSLAMQASSELEQSCPALSLELELDDERPPSHMGSLLSLTQSASGQWDDAAQPIKHLRRRPRKKSLPATLMVKRALGNCMSNQGSTENIDSSPFSILENVKPPSEMDNIIDMESSMVSVSSIVSEVADVRNQPIIFDFKQPVSDSSLLGARANLLTDLDDVNPPSLFNELMMESTIELEQITAVEAFDDCISNTLNHVTDIPSGSENCTPLQSDFSSVESTPKKTRHADFVTPKERRRSAKERYMTYTIGDEPGETLQLELTDECFDVKSECSSKTEEFVTARSDSGKKKLSPKQKRQEDRARYQTQTVCMPRVSSSEVENAIDVPIPDGNVPERKLLAKKSLKQKRSENSDRYKTITLSDEATPSPVTGDGSRFIYPDDSENVENGERYILDLVNDADDIYQHSIRDEHLDSGRMLTYTKSLRSYVPDIESPTAVDVCVAKNLKNIQMSAAHGVHAENAHDLQPGVASGSDGTSIDYIQSTSEGEMEMLDAAKVKPKIMKPKICVEREDSLESNDSCDVECNSPKAVRGRKKATYVSPYKRNVANPKESLNRPAASKSSAIVKPMSSRGVIAASKVNVSSKFVTPLSKATITAKTFSRTFSNQAKSQATMALVESNQKNCIPVSAVKPVPIVRQGTFTKEESTVLPKVSNSTVETRPSLSSPRHNSNPNTSPSRLPQRNRQTTIKPPLRKTLSGESPTLRFNSTRTNISVGNRSSLPAMKNSSSNQSLQSNDSGRTVTLNRNSLGCRTVSNSGIGSGNSRAPAKEATSKIASLWKRVEQTKRKEQSKSDDRVWISNNSTEQGKVTNGDVTTGATSGDVTSRLIRSSTFEGQPKPDRALETGPKQKSSIAIRVSHIPNLRHSSRSPRSTEAGPSPSSSPGSLLKATATKIFARKNHNTNQEVVILQKL